nr:NADH dehydrogenase subunit 6 [Eutomostethus vegetus]
MNKMLILILILNSILFYNMKTPLSMGLLLFFKTLLITLISGLMSFNFWYSYILFLIMVGGMLILFIYVTSLTSNQKFMFSLKKNNMMLFTNLFFMMMLIIFFMSKFKHSYLSINLEMLNFMNLEDQNFFLKMSLNKLYNKSTSWIMIILMNYLLLTLFITVKITSINMGPLRKN